MALKILLVDDNPIVGEAFGLVLRRDGFEVTTESNATAGAEHLERGAFDAVISDLRMPGRDGLWLLDRAKALHPECFCVLMSADGNIDGRQIAKRPEVDRFFVKPVDRAKLAEELRSAHAGRRAM